MIALTTACGFYREPFPQDVPVAELYPLPSLQSFLSRFGYAVEQRLSSVITSEEGSGKSTSLRAADATLHLTQYRVLSIMATTGSLMELLLQVALTLGDPPLSSSVTKTLTTVRKLLSQILAKHQVPVLIVDEAHLLRLDVFSQLHTVTQVDFNLRTLLPIVFSGQTAIIDRLLYHTSRPFASHIIGRSHMEALQREHMASYLSHHLSSAGGKLELFSFDAVIAIHQSSGGLLRRAGVLARGALLAAASEKCPVVSAEHVRIALTEII